MIFDITENTKEEILAEIERWRGGDYDKDWVLDNLIKFLNALPDWISVKYIGEDEIYTTLVQCENCACEYILGSFAYCPQCGLKINWQSRSRTTR